jgi:beta-lactamase superfamily II metal-dependent hydrolase
MLEFLQPKELYDNGEPLSLDVPEHRWYEQTVRGAANYHTLKAGDRLKSKNVSLEVLSPEVLGSDWNSNSLVLKLTANGHTALLMADGNLTTEKLLLNSGEALQAEILQVGHHGAIDASSSEFLQAVSPHFAVISINSENTNGYPHTDTIEKLHSIEASLYVTHQSGTVSFILSADGIEIRTERAS